MIRHERGKLTYFSYKLFEPFKEVTNVVSSRIGGVSQKPFYSLNVGLNVCDEEAAVINNRKLLCEAIGVKLHSLIACRQTHETKIAIVGDPARGRGAFKWSDGLLQTDGLITNIPELPLLITVADCAVLSFFDPKHKVVAIAHGGWRGIAGKIARKTVFAMEEAFGSRPQDILVGISPLIGPCCYKIGKEVVKSFYEAFGNQALKFFIRQPDGCFHLDLHLAIKCQLEEAGIKEEQIESSPICPACNLDLFYSHRAECGKTGRFAGLISLRA